MGQQASLRRRGGPGARRPRPAGRRRRGRSGWRSRSVAAAVSASARRPAVQRLGGRLQARIAHQRAAVLGEGGLRAARIAGGEQQVAQRAPGLGVVAGRARSRSAAPRSPARRLPTLGQGDAELVLGQRGPGKRAGQRLQDAPARRRPCPDAAAPKPGSGWRGDRRGAACSAARASRSAPGGSVASSAAALLIGRLQRRRVHRCCLSRTQRGATRPGRAASKAQRRSPEPRT